MYSFVHPHTHTHTQTHDFRFCGLFLRFENVVPLDVHATIIYVHTHIFASLQCVRVQ